MGPEVDRLEWDVKTYFALNGALHDAAIAAWGDKGFFDSVRPDLHDPLHGWPRPVERPKRLPSYDPNGLPLVPGLVELVTKKTAPRASATRRSGSTSARSPSRRGRATRPIPRRRIGGVGWILAKDWVPYQQPTFVTPAFPGFVSGHSTFSRAAAEVLTSLTGLGVLPRAAWRSSWCPRVSSDRRGRTVHDVPLQWATYYDAADQAGISRLYGGIHIPADDFGGRQTGSHLRQDRLGTRQPVLRGTAPAS